MLQKTFTNIAGDLISDSFATEVSPIKFIKPKQNKTLFQRISESDKVAIREFLQLYGDYIWAITRKFTKNVEQSEVAIQQVFQDIWANAKFFDSKKTDEKSFIAQVTLRRLMKNHSQVSKLIN